MKSFLTENEQEELSKIIEEVFANGYNNLPETLRQRRVYLLIKKYGE